MSFPVRERLRAETHAAHAALDAKFLGFDIGTGPGYRRFLAAHARALLPIEAAIGSTPLWAEWRPRGALLRGDLAALGEAVPDPLHCAPPSSAAEGWGMMYVVEGSRLGGVVLAERVPPGAPRDYLLKRHAPGEWRGFLAALEAASDGGDAWLAGARSGADAAFALFAAAAAPAEEVAHA